ncbi:MAG: FixH family protein [Pseudomonadota bacterium]
MKPITGTHVATLFALGFGTIISVNLALAWNAVQTFPGLEVKNAYVASQAFERDRSAQTALDWQVSARLIGERLELRFAHQGRPVQPVIEQAIFGRATSVVADQTPDFTFDGSAFVAPVTAGDGNWNLRLTARAANGTLFRQRLVVEGGT